VLRIVWRVAGKVALLDGVGVSAEKRRAQVVPRKASIASGRRVERQLRRVHLQRHGREEIVGADRRLQEVVQRPVDVRRRTHPCFDRQAEGGAPRVAKPAVVRRGRIGYMERIEKQHEQTIARVAGHLVRPADVARVRARLGCRAASDDDVLESVRRTKFTPARKVGRCRSALPC